MGLFSWAVLGGVCAALFFAIRSIVGQRRSGGCAGCSGCSHCDEAACAGCSSKEAASEKPRT